MIDRCPHCNIELKKPPMSGRETNEMLLVLTYRKMIESGANLKTIEKLGHCPVCRATISELREQIRISEKNILIAKTF
jgi:uncharacterized protein with PIN domain